MQAADWNSQFSKLQLSKRAKFLLVGTFVVAVGFMFIDTARLNNYSLTSVDDVSTSLFDELDIDEEDQQYYFRKSFFNDNYHRCQGKLSFNLDNASQITVDEYGNSDVVERLAAAGGRFVVGTFNNVDDAGKAAEFVMAARRQSMRPIVEVDMQNSNDFRDSANIVRFYEEVNSLTNGSKFVATLSIPFSTAFNNNVTSGSVGEWLANQMGEVASQIYVHENIALSTPMMQESRACTGDDDESSCLNIEDDFRVFAERIFLGNMDPAWIDYYFINWKNYDVNFKFKEVTQEGQSAANQEESSNETRRAFYVYQLRFLEDLIRNYEQEGIFQRVIVGDFGPGDGTTSKNGEPIANSILQERLAYDFGQLSDDPRIEGIVLSDEAERIFSSTEDRYRLSLEGTNCNYDTVDYEIEYDDRSKASVVKTEAVGTSSGSAKAKTRVVCSGETAGGEGGLCIGTIRYTLKVGLPIRHCGSNSPFGTDSRPYATPSVLAALRYNVPLDYLNQSAGALSLASGGGDGEYEFDTYAMPWFNNCIVAHYPDYSNSLPVETEWQLFNNLSLDTLNRGVTLANTQAEFGAEDEQFHQFKVWQPGASTRQTELDERFYFVGRDVGISKDYIDISAGLNDFSSIDYSVNRKEVEVDAGSIDTVVRDPQNMIYGDEVIIKEVTVFEKGANRLAWEEYAHRIRNGGHLHSAKDIYETQSSIGEPNICPCFYDANLDGEVNRTMDPNNPDWTSMGDYYAVQNSCQPDDDAVNGGSCIKYKGGEGVDSLDTYEESDYIVEADFPEVPEYDLDGAYDALAALYNRVQTKLSAMGYKLILNENKGWEGDVSIKAYSVPPWFKPRAISGARENYMTETYDFPAANVSSAEIASVAPASRVAGAASDAGVNSCNVGTTTVLKTYEILDKQDEINEIADYGYGYAQVQTYGSSASEDAEALNRLCDAGITPILRSCDKGRCDFDSMGSTPTQSGQVQGNYLNGVVNNATACDEVYVVCGHNEPYSEYAEHADNESPDIKLPRMVSEGQFAAGCYSTLSGNSKAKITTPIFNATLGLDGDGDPSTNFTQEVFQKFYEGFNSVTSYNDANFACLAFNTYSNVGNQSVGQHYNTMITSHINVTGSPPDKVCVMETGIDVDSSSEQSANAETVVSELLSTAGDQLEFFLYFNSTGDPNDSSWGRFALSPEVNEQIGSCQVEGGQSPAGSTGDYDAPGLRNGEYNMYWTEGDNFVRERQYYEQVGNLDYLHLVDTVFVGESSVEFERAAATVGLLFCEDLPDSQKGKVDCLAPYAEDPRVEVYVEDPLGTFLCNRGYPIVAEDCNLQCEVSEGILEYEDFDTEVRLRSDIDPLLYPVGSDIAIPNCSASGGYSPSQPLRNVNLGNLQYFHGGFEEDSSVYTSYPEVPQMQLIDAAATDLESMLAAMPENVRNTCAFNWGYRSPGLQSEFGSCGAGTGTACACYSEHQLGTTLDFANPTTGRVSDFVNTACFDWVTANAADYGFVRSYKPDNPDGYSSEPWHWRWLPEDHAQKYKANESSVGHLKTYLLELATEPAEESPQTPSGEAPALNGSFACPLANDRCWQGPLGAVTHYCSPNSEELAFDFYGSSVVHAPENGQIVFAEGNEDYNCTAKTGVELTRELLYEVNEGRTVGNVQEVLAYIDSLDGNYTSLQSSGGAIGFVGESGLYYRMRHIDITSAEASIINSQKPTFSAGQALSINGRTFELYHVPGEVYTPCWRGAHLHTWAKTGVDASDISGTKTGQYVNQYQLYTDVLGCNSANSCKFDNACDAPNWANFDGSPTDTGSVQCIETVPGEEYDDGQQPVGQCNEFNCAPRDPRFGNFTSSLNCAANTIANDVNAGKTLALILDEYGPYCDNETRGVLESGISRMPFAYNAIAKFYDLYSPQGVRCNVIPPNTPRPEDLGKSCSDFSSENLRSPSNPAWQYYRGGLENCVSNANLRWDPGSGGLTVEALADKLIEEAVYNGSTMRDDVVGAAVPRDKVIAVVQAAKERDINPYLLVAFWATESWFGKLTPECNV